jgi:hypothetical protein
MRRSRRSQAAKQSRRGWSTRPSTLLADKVYGELQVVVPDSGNRKNGHRTALVEDVKTGEQKEVRVDNLLSGNTQSCGRIKKERYKEKLAKMIPETDLEAIDRATLASARAWVGVDALTGEQIEPNKLAERKFSVIEYERRLRKREQREQEQRERELAEEDARLLDENEAIMKAQAERWRLLPLMIQQAKPHLTWAHGFVTFEKLPRGMRSPEVREAMERAGLIDGKLRVTVEGIEWFLRG